MAPEGFRTKPIMAYCQLDTWKQISVKFESKYKHFRQRTCILKLRPLICEMPNKSTGRGLIHETGCRSVSKQCLDCFTLLLARHLANVSLGTWNRLSNAAYRGYPAKRALSAMRKHGC